ncbi:ankyrin repeat-containing protein ITN1-like [Eucalyptus grandis]|uniref:ankyrin repeat-containing protein ITN1-like n=1 Tax=Eucalyptus grandis TaxID=71139 RepID=UPI00192EF47A|nr:ankyrin repeat-containing protein ITN1-like [Eucalyptus grandis]
MARGKIAHRMLRVVPFVNRIGELKLRHECWLELSNLAFKRIKDHKETPEILKSISDIVLQATSSGIFEIVKLCLKQYPELMWDEEFAIQLVKKVVRARHVELYRLLNAYDTIPRLRHNLMSEVVEWTPGNVPADVSGSAFLMQRELQWFQVLEDRSSPLLQSTTFKVMKDESDPSSSSLELEPVEKGRGKTCWELFLEQRKDLLQEAEQWMNDTSTSCSLVATLITTVAFAAAFTVPGGNDNIGIPIFLKKTSFMVFAIADALALFSSITATLMFLAILTSRYAAKDFLHSLPRKMILGLTFLFLSSAFMLVAFGSALTTVLSGRWEWIYIPITLLAAIPVILFVILQLPLYVEMVESTYRPRLYHPMKIWK